MIKAAAQKAGPRVGRWRIGMWSAIAAILLFPLVAMQFTPAVAWTLYDFIVAGALLIGAGAIFELVTRLVRRPAYQAAIGAALLGVVALVRAQGAVGVF